MQIRLFALILAGVLVYATGLSAAVIHVPADAPTISEAVFLTGPGDTILVAPGIHQDVEIQLAIHGLVIMSEGGAEVTTIVPPPEATTDNYFFRLNVVGDETTVIKGFTLDGCSNGVGGFRITLPGSRPLITNNVIACRIGGYFEFETEAVIANNTFVGCDEIGIFGVRVLDAAPLITHNIITGSPVGVRCCAQANLTITCNDVWGNYENYSGICPDLTGVDGNISQDPVFCDLPGGDYQLDCQSPCVNGLGCGQMGAFGVGCGPTATDHTTWGTIKAFMN